MVRGLMSDDEWAFFAPFVLSTGAKSGRPPADHRRILDGVFWIARTGTPWRDLHEHFGKWGSAHRQFRRWTLAGGWDAMQEALRMDDDVPDTVQMTPLGGALLACRAADSTVVRAHQHSAGAPKLPQANLASSISPQSGYGLGTLSTGPKARLGGYHASLAAASLRNKAFSSSGRR